MGTRASLTIACVALACSGCALPPRSTPSAAQETQLHTLVGAWEVTSHRSRGVGKNLLTFSSDGTFFRSGDSHPVLSGAHGAWKQTAPGVFEASYVAFSFDGSGKWSGVNRNNLRIQVDPSGNAFKGTVKTSNRDLQENVLSSGTAALEGRRIQVQPYD